MHHRDMRENLKKILKPLGKELLVFPEATKCFWDKADFGNPHEIVLKNLREWGWVEGQLWGLFLGLGQLGDGLNTDAFYFLEKKKFILSGAYLHAKYLEIHLKCREQQRKRVGTVDVSTSL